MIPIKSKNEGEIILSKYLYGKVVKVFGAYYFVNYKGQEYKCVLRGKVKNQSKKSKNIIVTGDEVEFSINNIKSENNEEREGVIEKISPRKNKLFRRSLEELLPRNKKNLHYNEKPKEQIIASNIDQIIIMSSCSEPDLNCGFIDRILVFCEKENILPIITITKSDLININDFIKKNKLEIYSKLGYETILLSSKDNYNINLVKHKIKDKTSVLIGPSGVGKSTLINKICKKEILKTNEVNKLSHKGVHTTTNVFLIQLPFGGFIIDTPGIKEFAYPDLEKWQLSLYFPEMKYLKHKCKYKTCTHSHEPYCAVKDNLDKGIISKKRYESYLKILETIE